MTPIITVHRDEDVLAAAAAARLITRIVDVQSEGVVPKVVLTGGGAGIAMLEQIRATAAHEAVDWGEVEFYWGDERFLPPGDPERNDTQAWAALLDHVGVDRAKVFAMGADEGSGPKGADAAAAAYAEVLAGAAGSAGGVPEFHVMLLGMGGEGHTASVFPDSPAVHDTEHTVVAVYDCPKPPPTRVSLTLPAIRRSAEVWVVTTGDAKAEAVAAALTGASEVDIPVAGARGALRTRFLIDRAAAAKLPAELLPRLA